MCSLIFQNSFAYVYVTLSLRDATTTIVGTS